MQDLAFPYAELYSNRKKLPDPPPFKPAVPTCSKYRFKNLTSKVSSRESLYQHEKSFLPCDVDRSTQGFLFHSAVRKNKHKKLEPSQASNIPRPLSPPPEAPNWKSLLLQTERILGRLDPRSSSTHRSNSLIRTRVNSRVTTALPSSRNSSNLRLGISRDQLALKLTGRSQKLMAKSLERSSGAKLSSTLHLDLSRVLRSERERDLQIRPPLVTLSKKRRNSLDKNLETESDLMFDDRMEARYV